MHPIYFPELYQASLRAGEQAGNLPEVLKRYIDYLKMIIGVREKVVKATIYPLFLLGFGLLVHFRAIIFRSPIICRSVPGKSCGITLGDTIVIGRDQFSRSMDPRHCDHSGFTWCIWVYWWRTTPQGQWRIHWLFLNAPVLGPLFQKNQVIRLTRTLSTILGGGITLLSALQVTAQSMPNKVFARALNSVINHVREGTSLSVALKKEKFLPQFDIGNDRSRRRNNRIIGNHGSLRWRNFMKVNWIFNYLA